MTFTATCHKITSENTHSVKRIGKKKSKSKKFKECRGYMPCIGISFGKADRLPEVIVMLSGNQWRLEKVTGHSQEIVQHTNKAHRNNAGL